MSGQAPGDGGTALSESANPYAAPEADAVDRDDERVSDAGDEREYTEFYVASQQKFLLLACMTFGLYTFYWFFAQFRRQRRRGLNTYPFFAALLNVFTAHRLFKRIDRAARREGLHRSGRATSQTLPYVCLALGAQLLLRLSEGKAMLALGFVCSLVSALPLARVQMIANRVVGDPEGRSNSKLSALNVIAIMLGGIFWLFILMGMLTTGSSVPE